MAPRSATALSCTSGATRLRRLTERHEPGVRYRLQGDSSDVPEVRDMLCVIETG